ncbi:MAG TPA: NHL repeat-containing protein [Rhodocyclaceae bacterium]
MTIARLLACLLIALAAAPLSAQAQCRADAVSALPMPAATWLRSWTGPLASPARLDVDAAGRVLVADPARGRLVRRAADGSLIEQIATGGQPSAVAIDPAGGFWVGDAGKGTVTRHDVDGQARFALGVGDGEFGQPGDIAVDPADGSIYVSDTARQQVSVYSPGGVRLRSIGTAAPADDLPAPGGQFRTPTGIVIAGDELLVGDQLNFRIQAFDKQSGAFRYCLGTFRASSFFSPNSGPARSFGTVQGLWVDALGRLYVVDAYQGQVVVVDRSNGAIIGRIGSFGDEPGALRVPADVVIDGNGRLFVSNGDAGRLEIFGLDGFVDLEAVVPGHVQIEPARIDRRAPPGALALAVEAPGYRSIDIDPDDVTVNGVAAQVLEVADADGNGVPELRLTLRTADLLPTLADGEAVAVSVSAPLGTLRLVANTSVAVIGDLPGDSDGDGIDDFRDRCPASAAGAVVDRQGCAIAQRCQCDGSGSDKRKHDDDDRHRHAHGAYVRCVEKAAAELRSAGRITQQAFRSLVRDAAQSSCGRTR